MGWLGVAISAVAAWLLWDDGWLLYSIAIAVGIIQFWSWGVMHNYAVEEAKKRPNYTGKFFDFTAREADAAPNFLAIINLISFVAAVALLIFGFVI